MIRDGVGVCTSPGFVTCMRLVRGLGQAFVPMFKKLLRSVAL
jgi:hypothetical protein